MLAQPLAIIGGLIALLISGDTLNIFSKIGLVLLIGLGAGSEINKPLSVAIIGSMISSTLVTLVVVPAAHSLVMNGLENFYVKRLLKQPV
jgi:multidrug efflux pump subunit AcrB